MLLEMEKIHLKIKNGTSRNILAAAMRHNSERMTAEHVNISGDKHGKKHNHLEDFGATSSSPPPINLKESLPTRICFFPSNQ